MMAATVQDPPRQVAGREGPLKWAPDPHRPKDQWLAPDGERCDARIRFLSNQYLGKDTETWYVYRGGRFFGVRGSMVDAKKLAQSDKADPNPEYLKATMDGEAEGLPAFLNLSQAEHRYLRKIAPTFTVAELRTSWRNYKMERAAKGEDLGYMSKYESMGVEQLAREANNLVDQARAMGIDRFRQRARFKDKDEGLKFIEEIESSIRARQSSEKAVKQEARDKTGPTAREVIPASPQPTKELDTMANNGNGKKAKKKVAKKKVAKKAGKKAAAAPKGPKVYERPATKAGEFTEKLGTRPGTNRDKLALHLFANLGKMVALDKVTKAVYGKDAPGLPNVINGLRNDIDAAKVSYHIKREDNAIGLFTGNGK